MTDLQLAVVRNHWWLLPFEILPRTGKWIHRHKMTLTIHKPIAPQRKSSRNIKETLERNLFVENYIAEKYKGMIYNADQRLNERDIIA